MDLHQDRRRLLQDQGSGQREAPGDRGLSRADGGTAGIWGDAAAPQQHWAVTPTGDGHFILVNRYSGLALAVDEGSTADAAAVEQQPYTSQTHQQWKIIPF